MSLISYLDNLVATRIGQYFPPGEDIREVALELILRSRHNLYVVAGELRPGFYNGRFSSVLEQKLESISSYRVGILFHKSDNRCEATRKMQKENRALCKLLRGGNYGGRLLTYWANLVPMRHFLVADHDVLIEKLYDSGSPGAIFIRRNDPVLAKRYRDLFRRMVNIQNVAHPFNFPRIPRA